MPEKETNLQRSSFKWIQVVDEVVHKITGPVKQHAGISANEVATKYGVPDDVLRKYLRLELEKEESCRSLPFTLLMVISYTAMVIGHDPQVPVNAVESAIVFDVEENANFAFTSPFIGHKGMYDANSPADIWSWMIQGLAPLVFQQSRGFGEGVEFPAHDPYLTAAAEMPELARDTRGMYLNFDRIVGGLRIRQERGKFKDCQTMEKLRHVYNKRCSDRYGGSGYELYPELKTAMATFDPQREFWLWAHDNVSYSLEVLRQKERENWIDSGTTKVEIVVPIYNAQFGLYSVVLLDFYFSYGGHIWKRIIPFSTYSTWFYGFWNYFPDMAWLIGLLWILATESFSIYTVANSKTGGGGWKAVKSEYLSFWNVIDWTNVWFGVWIIIGFCMRFVATQDLNRSIKNLGVLDEEGQRERFREMAETTVDKMEMEVKSANIFRLIQGAYPLIVVLRVFKAFAHQPRLSIVTRTVYASFVDLLHFLVVFMSVMFSFGTSGVILFGRDIDGFTHPLRAFTSCFNTMMGDFDWDELNNIGRFEAGCWFFGFMIMIVVLLLNMLLAIVMDAYSEQKAAIGDAETLWYELYVSIIRWREVRKGERRTLHEVYRAYREIKQQNATWNISRNPIIEEETEEQAKRRKRREKLLRKSGTKDLFRSVSSLSVNIPLKRKNSAKNEEEVFKLVTVKVLMDHCKGMQYHLAEWQAIEILENAATMHHSTNKESTNIEEMTRIIRKVDDGTKDIRRLLLADSAKSHHQHHHHDSDDDDHHHHHKKDQDMFNHVVDEFEEQFWGCREELQAAKSAVGQEFPAEMNEHIPGVHIKHKTKSLVWDGELVMQPVYTMEEALDPSVKCILNNKEEVLKACRDKDLKADKDDLRIQCLGRSLRVVEADHRDNTVMCRVPAVGDVWFPINALAHLRPKPSEDLAHHYHGRYGRHMSAQEGALATIQGHEYGAKPKTSVDFADTSHAEALRKLHDLESELRVGRQTVMEAQDAMNELQRELKQEEDARLKLAQKLTSLRKKVAARTKEQHHLRDTLKHQDERREFVSNSKNEYLGMVHSLFDKKKQLKGKLQEDDDTMRSRSQPGRKKDYRNRDRRSKSYERR